MKHYLCGLALLVALLIAAGSARADSIFWTETDFGPGGVVRKANLDGSGVTTLATGLDSPRFITADLSSGKIYWTDGLPNNDPNTGDIRRANFDGTAQEVVVNQQIFPTGVAVDPSAGKLYWSAHVIQQPEPWGLDIRRSNLDGTGKTVLVHNTSTDGNAGLAFDFAQGKMYWTNLSDGTISRSNLDGTNQQSLLTGQDLPWGIAIDAVHGQMYWCDNSYNSEFGDVRRANLDGSHVQVLASGLLHPAEIALDVAAGKTYWTDYGNVMSDGTVIPNTGDIRRANLDGSNQEVLIPELTGPAGIAVSVPEPSACAMLGVVAGCVLLRARRRRSLA